MKIIDCSAPGSYDATCRHIWGGPGRTKCRMCPARCERDARGTIVAFDACTPAPFGEQEDLSFTEESDLNPKPCYVPFGWDQVIA